MHALHHITLHYITLHHITLHYITLRYITYIYIYTLLGYLSLARTHSPAFAPGRRQYSGEYRLAALPWGRKRRGFVTVSSQRSPENGDLHGGIDDLYLYIIYIYIYVYHWYPIIPKIYLDPMNIPVIMYIYIYICIYAIDILLCSMNIIFQS